MKPYQSENLTPETIQRVKETLKTNGEVSTSLKLELSRRVVNDIKKGMYDTTDPENKYWHNRCPITGLKFYKEA